MLRARLSFIVRHGNPRTNKSEHAPSQLRFAHSMFGGFFTFSLCRGQFRATATYPGGADFHRRTETRVRAGRRWPWAENSQSATAAEGRHLCYGRARRGAHGDVPEPHHAAHRRFAAKHGVYANTTFDPLHKNFGGWYW